MIMKRIAATALAIMLLFACFCMAGCKSAAYDYDLTEYITLPDYRNMKIDTKSNDYQMGLQSENYSNLSELEVDDLITETEYTKGTVQPLDIVNIDYVGRKDGVAFEGGTAEGYDLQIGSSSFIEGFEAGLVGVKIGDTVDLNLTFPENYGSAELAGTDVVFTVTVNRLNRPVIAPITDDIAAKLGFGSATEYQQSLESTYYTNHAWSELVNSTKVLQYPEREKKQYIDANIEQMEQQAATNNTTLDAMLSSYGMTVEDYREQLEPYAESYVLQNMITHAIAKAENLSIDKAEVDEQVEAAYSGKTYTDADWQSVYDSMLQQEVVAFLESVWKE